MIIEQLTVYNVGFGDCIKFELKNGESVLLDCGGNLNNKKKVKIKNDIKENQKGNVNVIISHFHNDHYNILQLFENETIDVLYIPNFFTKDIIKIYFYLLLVQSLRSSVYLFALELLQLIPNLVLSKNDKKSIVKKNGQIIFTKKDDMILDKFHVLWPDINKTNNITSKINQVFHDYFHNNQYINDHIDELARRYEEQINNIQNREFPTTYSANINIFEYAALQIQEIVNEGLQLREQLNEKLKFNNRTKNIIKNFQNSMSLVFQTNDKKCLFLGDVTKKCFEDNILDNIDKEEYYCIKISHHGTKKYFSEKLPKKTKGFIISNGKKEINKPIDDRYYSDEYYKDVKIICTNIKDYSNTYKSLEFSEIPNNLDKEDLLFFLSNIQRDIIVKSQKGVLLISIKYIDDIDQDIKIRQFVIPSE